MNDLSWMLYFASVVPQVSTAICVFSVLMFLITAPLFLMGVGEVEWFPRDEEANYRVNKRLRKILPLLIVFPLLWFSTFLVPGDKETFYAIAASEMGEEVLKTPEVGKARQALNKWLDEQLSTEEAKSEQ